MADLHLCHRPPVARSCEEDWYGVMGGYLDQLRLIQKEFAYGEPLQVFPPVLMAGDLFDAWQQPCSLLNYLIPRWPPECYAVPGNHDLPGHSYDEIKRTAYWNLVEARVVRNLDPGEPREIVGAATLRVHAFPCGFEPKPMRLEPHDLMLDVAVVHAYVWTRETGYPDAPAEQRLKAVRKQFQGYDAVFIGDNHKPWQSGSVVNCGAFMRRKQDERDHKPSAVILYADGSTERRYLDASRDRFVDPEEVAETLLAGGLGIETFVEELRGLGDAAIDFADAVRRLLERKKVDGGLKKTILALLEGGKR